jgi:transcriptional regulator with XRE-family HTH domain
MTLYKYERNLCEPRGDVIAKMADALHTTTDFLLGRTKNPEEIIYDNEKEKIFHNENIHMKKYRKLSEINKARIYERINVLL